MSRLIINSTSLAQWHALVNEAELNCGNRLTEEMESYLVFLLQRFTKRPEIATKILACDFLKGQQAVGVSRIYFLREVGDSCLIVAGLFPEQAAQRLVSISYFVEMGQSAYYSVSTLFQHQPSQADLYASLQDQFIPMMDTLHSIRELGGESRHINLMLLEEIWRETGSSYALKLLQNLTQASPLFEKNILTSKRSH